jgi:hypothetical protein
MGEINGAILGFLLTPVPEPATLSLLLAIASLLPRGRRELVRKPAGRLCPRPKAKVEKK